MFFQTRSAKTIVFAKTRQGFKSFYRKTKTLLLIVYIVICFAALIFDPFSAFIVGGVGAFFGDMLFYPAPMFVSLVTHGLQAVAISLIAGKKNELAPLWKAIVAVAVGAVIMVTGYSLGRAFIYSTPEYAIIKLPFQILQALVGAALGTVILYATPIKRYSGFIPKD